MQPNVVAEENPASHVSQRLLTAARRSPSCSLTSHPRAQSQSRSRSQTPCLFAEIELRGTNEKRQFVVAVVNNRSQTWNVT